MVSGAGGKLLRCTLARLPESAGHACLAGAVVGALTATGLWVARRDNRRLGAWRGLWHPLAALGAFM